MKWIRRILIVIAALIAAMILISWIFIKSKKPDYNENNSLPGLSGEVSVYYDDFAIPHIYASSEQDAYLALGYVHAKERLWQMEVLRRIAPGRLSELFGKTTLETDIFFRTLGIRPYAQKSVAYYKENASPEIKELVQAYIDGVNHFISEGPSPIEFHILGVDKSPFSLDDIFHIGDYMAFSFAMAHKTEPVLTDILEELGPEYLEDLNVHVDTTTVMIRGATRSDYRNISLNIGRIMESLPAPIMIGSNSWIIGSQKSVSGKPLFSNDPHIGFAQPAVWFEAHLEAPGLSLYGNFAGGLPFPYLGHTDRHAIGLTMLENDDIDFYKESVNPDNPDQYQYNNEWLDFELGRETIHVKGGDDETIEVKKSVHGPIMSSVTDGMDPNEDISMWWSYLQFPNRSLEATYQLMNASSPDEARSGAAMIHGPGVNVMYADIEGNIAWWAAAKLPKRPDHVNSKLILDGSTDRDEVKEYYTFDENPHSVNPESGFVYSANNQPYSDGAIQHPGYYLPEDRARRIVSLLESKETWNVEDIKEMLLDVTSENVPEIVASIDRVIDKQSLKPSSETALNALNKWNAEFNPESIEAVIYTKLVFNILKLGMGDELGESFDIYNGTHVMKRTTQVLLANEHSIWWDNIHTEAKEEARDIYSVALNKSIEELMIQLGEDMNSWKWSSVHTIEHPHSLGSVRALKLYFNIGPFEVPGTTEVINNLQFRLSGDGIYEVFAGPSCRRIVDFNDIRNNSWSILPTGQSGNPMSPHYADQAQLYINGKFRKKLMNQKEIQENFRYKSIFSPQN